MFEKIKSSIKRLGLSEKIKLIPGETAFFVRLSIDGQTRAYNSSKLNKELASLQELRFDTAQELFDRWIDIQLY